MSLGADIQGSAPNAPGIAHLRSGDPVFSPDFPLLAEFDALTDWQGPEVNPFLPGCV